MFKIIFGAIEKSIKIKVFKSHAINIIIVHSLLAAQLLYINPVRNRQQSDFFYRNLWEGVDI